jgi:hypothetical protein
LVVPAIRSGEVARLQGSAVWQDEHALQSLDLRNGLFGVHSFSNIYQHGLDRQTDL